MKDLSVLIALAAAGKLSRRDWQVIDALHIRGMGVRETGRMIGLSERAVRKRRDRIKALA